MHTTVVAIQVFFNWFGLYYVCVCVCVCGGGGGGGSPPLN